MIALSLPESWLILLRWVLLLGPVCLTLSVTFLRNLTPRAQIAGLFAFLYGVTATFVGHSLAVWIGWWHYGWDALMLNGLPADVVIGGAILFGPGLYFSFPNTRLLILLLPIIIGLHGTIFRSLEPLVFAGPNWFLGILFVFATAHLPAIYLAKWTETDTQLPFRCALLAVMTGGMIFVVIPSLIMKAMGGAWYVLDRPAWIIVPTAGLLAITSLIGIAANQSLCLQGQGTPIPLDPTKRLVTTGIYAYLSNPMQLSAALNWLVLGAFLHNIWVMAASLMAWFFVQGMVRWHHRNDLLKRFPVGWPDYKAKVPEWFPRWHPSLKACATLHLSASSRRHRRVALWLGSATQLRIQWSDDPLPHYENPDNVRDFDRSCAIAAAAMHKNFAYALVGHAWLLLALPARSLSGWILKGQR